MSYGSPQSLKTLIFPALLLTSSTVFAANAPTTLGVTATVSPLLSVTLDKSTLTFTDTDPGTTPIIQANENPIGITSKGRISSATGANLTVSIVSTDLTSTSGGTTNTIPAKNLTVSATGTGYIAGPTPLSNTAQTIGKWTSGGTYAGTLSFSLANNWNYNPGTYTGTETFTITAS